MVTASFLLEKVTREGESCCVKANHFEILDARTSHSSFTVQGSVSIA